MSESALSVRITSTSVRRPPSKGATVWGGYQPFTGDFDGDGADDIFWYAPGTSGDRVWYSTPGSRNGFISVPKTVDGTFRPMAGDFNGDGYDDAFWYGPGSGADRLWWGRANRTSFGPTGPTQESFSIGGDMTPVAGDFDGDGKDDAFLYDQGTGTDLLWWGAADGAFGIDAAQTGLAPTTQPSWSYGYDTNGNRIAKASNGGENTRYVWSDHSGLALLLEQDTNGVATQLIYGPGGMPVAQITGSTVAWYHHDQLGSTRLVTGATGNPLGTFTYDPYGALSGSTGAFDPLLDYAGQYSDNETGFQYLRARYYDPATGQFLTRDPLVAVTGEPYAYAGNDPINRVDPTGLDWWNPSTWTPVDRVQEELEGLCVDINNPNCESIAEQHPALATGLENAAIGASVVACTAGTFGACAVGVGFATTGSVVHDVSSASSEGDAIRAATADVLLGWGGLALFGGPLSLAGLPRWSEGALSAAMGGVQWLPDLLSLGSDC